jgi:hypothetical protein
MDYNNIFIIENITKSTYIDAILIALLYPCNKIITTDITNLKEIDYNLIYLQEYIKSNIINKIKKNKSIQSHVLLDFKQLLYKSGWEYDEDNNQTLNYEQYISKFYVFISKKIAIEPIKIIKNNQIIVPMSYITLNTPKHITNITIKQLFNSFLINNSKNSYTIQSPTKYLILPLYINRENNKDILIDLQKKIILNKHSLTSGITLYFYSSICYNTVSNYYYVLFTGDNITYYIYNNQLIPNIIKIDITNEIIAKLIKKECIFVFYKN